ncbi:DUF6531 domain-containing protein [Streptomyces sp. NPDC059556]|uniref:DUF6531 domain-containing protein n=1 Tax=Streptomyces sp. NPDC059556 TaxID=3346863 RepID=UPI00367DA176
MLRAAGERGLDPGRPDLVVQVSMDALGVQNGVDLDRTKQAGKDGFDEGVKGAKEGLNLASAGGGGGGGKGKGFHIEHDEHEQAGTKLNGVSVGIHGKTAGKLTKAKGHQGRNRGRDDIADALDPVIERAMGALVKSAKTMGDHIGETLPKAVKQISKDHKNNDDSIRDRLARQRESGHDERNPVKDPGDRGGRDKDARLKPDSLREVKSDPRRHGIELNTKKCVNDPVDVATGEMILPQTDLMLPGTLPVVLRRTHLSEYRYGQWFGRSWASVLDERLEIDPVAMGAVWARDDGSFLVYPSLPESGGEPVLPLEGPQLPLVYGGQQADETTYTVTDPQTGQTRSFTGSAYRPSIGYWLTEIQDRNNNRLVFSRSTDGAPTAVTHSGGYTVQVTTEAQRVTAVAVRGPEGPIPALTYGYDERGNLDAVTNSSGQDLRFGYDYECRITSWTDRNDSTFRYVYDAEGRVVCTVGPDGALSSTFTYRTHPDTGDRITRYTDSLGAPTVYHVNSRLQIISETAPLGATSTFVYDAHDRLLSSTDALGATARLEYGRAGLPVALVRADGHRTTVTYNDLGLVSTLTEPDGAIWHHEYDHRGNRTALTSPDGTTTRWAYDPRGGLASVTDTTGRTTHLTCTATGLPTAVTDSAGGVTHQSYDAFGRITTVTDRLGDTTHLSWTAEGLPAAVTAPDGSTERWTYDGEGNCTSRTDALGQTTRYEYTHFDLPSARITHDGVRHTFVYDTELRLSQVVNPQGLTWTYAYNAVGLLTEERDFDGHTVTYAYDAVGRLARRTNAAGQTVDYRYDSVGALVEKSVGDRLITFESDPSGRLLRATGLDGVLTYRYDRLGRVVEETVDGRTLTTSCDAAGRRTGRTTPSGVASAYGYDSSGNRVTVETAGRSLSFRYDNAGREVERTLGRTFLLSHEHDRAGRITDQLLTSRHSPQALQRRTYAYRSDGRPIGTSDMRRGHRRYELDAAGRVTHVDAARGWSETYSYDEAGNQTRGEWPESLPGADARGERVYTGTRITRAGQVRYEYDQQGRVILRQRTRLSRKPDTWRFSWDAEDRLISVVTPDGTPWRYLYDPLGRRIAKQRLGTDDRVLEETRFTWDGSVLVEQSTSLAGTPEVLTLTWDHEGYTPLSQTESKALAGAPQDLVDQRFFAMVTDQLGTPTELIDEHGDISWQACATLWGATTWNRDASAYTPLRFPGQYFDRETGLHHNYFRHYDPETARYLTLDPLGLAPAPNPTAYVDNPQAQTDPLGLSPCDETNPTWDGRVQYGKPGPHGRATAMHATVTKDMLGGKTNPGVDPAGWVSGQGYNRTHLLAAQLGGSNKDPRNFITMHAYANSPVMRSVENQVKKAAKGGETIQYSVTPIYADNSSKIPLGVTIEAYGNNGFTFTPRGSGGPGVNIVTIMNVAKR